MSVTIYIGDALDQLRRLPDESVHCVVSSPPYWGLRDYGVEGQMGLEATPAEFITSMVEVFEEVRRVLRSDGTCWVNMGDSYAGNGAAYGTEKSTLQGRRQDGMMGARRQEKRGDGLKPKDLCMMPHRLAIALQDAGWWVRQDIVWAKPNPMPESIRDRCTKAHEYIFLLSKSARYYYDADAIREPAQQWSGQAATFSRSGAVSEHVLPGQSAAQHRPRPNNGVGFGHGTDKESRQRERVKVPGGWDTGSGSHGTIHREGRTEAEYKEYEPSVGRNKRSVWTMATHAFPEAHFATFPPELPETCIKAGCPLGGIVLDPFFGAGTTGLVADRLQRDCIGIELNPAYAEMAAQRIRRESTLFAQVNVIQEEPPCQPSKTAA